MVEISDLQVRAELDGARIRLDLAEQELDQRALADVRTADHSNITAAEVFRFSSLFIFTHKLSLSNF